MLKNYLKTAFKVFLRRRFFTFISLFGISFTLVVLMVVVSLLDHAFGALAPETRLERTLGVFFARMSGPMSSQGGEVGYAFLDRFVRTLPNIEKVSLSTYPGQVISYHRGEKLKSDLKRTDGQFWEILQFDFLEGRPFTVEDEKSANFVAVINQATRKKFFDDAPAVGRFIEADGQRFRIVGVVRNVPILRTTPYADIWVPISTAKSDGYKKELVGNFMGTILARHRSDLDGIRQEVQARLTRVEFSDPKQFNRYVAPAETFFEGISRQLFYNGREAESHPGKLLGVILLIMLAFMLLPTLNLVNINVSRIMERSSEIGVRKAFGATSWTLVGQFIVENVLLTLVGGALGFVFAFWALQGLTQSGLIQYAEFHMNYRIFLYGLAIALFFGIFSGMYPAWKMSRLHPVDALRGRSL